MNAEKTPMVTILLISGFFFSRDDSLFFIEMIQQYTHTHIHIYTFFFIILFIMVYHKILNIVTCAIQ